MKTLKKFPLLILAVIVLLIVACKKSKTPSPFSVNPRLSDFAIPTKNPQNVPFDLVKPKSKSPGAFTYTSDKAEVATISGATVTIIGSGTATITASQAADGIYKAASITATLTVSLLKIPTLSNFTLPLSKYGDPKLLLPNPVSTSPSGVFKFTSDNPKVATSDGGYYLTIVGPGVASITATQSAADGFTAGTISTNLYVTIIRGAAYGGGIVVSIEGGGPEGLHGLIATSNDISPASGSAWTNNSDFSRTSATSTSDGSANTATILVNQGYTGSSAAQICYNYKTTMGGNTYDDWFLPASDQLKSFLTSPLGTTNSYYWSSNELPTNSTVLEVKQAYVVVNDPSNWGIKEILVTKDKFYKVRPIRVF